MNGGNLTTERLLFHLGAPVQNCGEISSPRAPRVVSVAADAFSGPASVPVATRRRLLRRLFRFGAGGAAGARVYADLGLLALRCVQRRRQGLPLATTEQTAYMVTLGGNLALQPALDRAAGAIAAAGVEAILYKGQDYLARIYGDQGARAMADIDLLVRPGDRAGAERALWRAGFRPAPAPGVHHEMRWVHAGVAVDLHEQFISAGRMRVDLEAVFARSRPSHVPGLRALEPTDAALVHCIAQAVKGHDLPASSYYELRWLLARADLGRMRRRAQAWRANTSLYASMHALAGLGCRRAAVLVRRVALPLGQRAALRGLGGLRSLSVAVSGRPPRGLLLAAKFALVDGPGDALRSAGIWAGYQFELALARAGPGGRT